MTKAFQINFCGYFLNFFEKFNRFDIGLGGNLTLSEANGENLEDVLSLRSLAPVQGDQI